MTAPLPIEIVGGGLAGLALGIALRRHGIPVTLHEAGSYPRHRVCGEFISGLQTRTLTRLGIAEHLADAGQHREVAWCVDRAPVRFQRLPAPALALSRHALDARLARAFTDLGGILHAHSRASISARAGLVVATGRRPAPRSPWIGLKVHASNLPVIRELEVHLGDDCYVGIASIENDKANICGLFRRRSLSLRGPALLLAYLRAAGLHALHDRLTAAEIHAESFCAVAAVAFDRRVPRTNEIRLGDAAAVIPPFTGNGMAMALQSAELALAPLLAFARHEVPWAAACRATALALRRHFRVRLASAAALHPFLLRPRRQRWLAALARARLLPFGPLYATLH